MKPTLIVLAGPNGSGKSTLYQARVAPSFAGPFINADIIQREELRNPSPQASYEAAQIATARRAEYLAQGRDFVTETVFSHPSKLALIDEARASGFTVIVMHVGVNTPELSVARVAARVEEGGHIVPEDKIRARYTRGAPFIRAAILKADRGMVFDNSPLNQSLTHCLTFSDGRLVFALPHLPRWIRSVYAADLVI
ncbi:zeta toxin family protein [Novosphingobium sp. SG720]|uniref:zeta toxin family protein n=1 Tax=Novosphingobium sp. SG720 TaxID=2586998 RepID=UPI001447FB60|nr:zeta toxin family protein [Novosphingobium sp. SG720]NKJ42427.1 putative ABC-type ATPase [Novosphingobium sp. SG720]